MTPTSVIDFEKLKATTFPAGSLPSMPNLTIGLIISKALTYLFVIAGLILLLFLIIGGFQLMIGAADPKAKEGASKTITNAILGFIILFVSYWLVQIVEVIFGISILK
jgi:hypothetical protein